MRSDARKRLTDDGPRIAGFGQTCAAALTAAADDLNQHAHTYADTLTPTDYAAADMALRQIGINLRDITNAAWHLALLDAAGRVRAAAIHEGAR